MSVDEEMVKAQPGSEILKAVIESTDVIALAQHSRDVA